MKICNYTIGADPEMFLINTKTNQVVSAIGIIPGKKDKPFKRGLPKGFGIEIDGILAEFNIPPCNDRSEYIQSIEFMKNWVRNFVKNKNIDLDICCESSMEVQSDQLQNKLANQRGCDPDYNAYTEEMNPRVDGYPSNIRCAGNHLHWGISEIRDFDTIVKLIKYCDLAIGLPSVFVDTDTERRKLYGKAGCFRKQPWCCEYRSLSSKMLDSDNLNKVWDGVEKVVELFNEDIPLPESDLIQECINTSNQVLAKHIIKLYEDIGIDLCSYK